MNSTENTVLAKSVLAIVKKSILYLIAGARHGQIINASDTQLKPWNLAVKD
jgi:hypothetical protein